MLYRIIAFFILSVVILIPLIAIASLAIFHTWVWWGYIAAHFWLLKCFFDWVKRVDEENQGGGSGDDISIMTTKEKVVGILRKEDGKTKKFS